MSRVQLSEAIFATNPNLTVSVPASGSVTVYERGGTALASIYSAVSGGTALPNPRPVSDGYATGYVDVGSYDLVASADGQTGDRVEWEAIRGDSVVDVSGATEGQVPVSNGDGTWSPGDQSSAVNVWAPDETGLFGGQQLVTDRAGVYAQAAVDTADNWSNDRRATEAQNRHVFVTGATGVRALWLNDINDQTASSGLVHATPRVEMGLFTGEQTIALAVSSGSLGGTFEIDITGPVTASTSALARNVSALDMARALALALGVPTSLVSVSKGGTANAPTWVVKFSDGIKPDPVLALDTASLTGTGAAGTVTNTAIPLDLRALTAPDTSLGDGTSSDVTVAPRSGVFGVPDRQVGAAKGDAIMARVYVDRRNDTATNRFPVQTTQTPDALPDDSGASQNVTGAGTSHAHSTKAAWDSACPGRLGILNTTLIGTPTGGPIANVYLLDDSIGNGSLDSTAVSDPERAYVRRAMKLLREADLPITTWSAAQGNETLQNLATTLAVTTNARRRILGAGCWSHVLIGHSRNDIQNGRTATQVIADYETVLTIIRAATPDHTKVILTTLPPYTNSSNVRAANSVMDDVLAWQLDEATELFDHVIDTGAVVASASNRQQWATIALGDPIEHLADGIHPNETGHALMSELLTADPSLWLPTGA